MATLPQPAGPAVERLGWYLGALAAPESLTLSALEEVYDPSDWDGRWTLASELEHLQGDDRVKRPFEVVRFEPPGDGHATAVVVGADGKRWSLTCWLSEAPPHRITGTRCIPAPPEGTTVRDARPEDAKVLAELERRAPLRLGETRMTFDRGDDYFASARLMEEVTVYVAEVEGQVAGVYWGAQQPVLVDGAPKVLFLEHHVRIDPEAPRGGVFWALVVYGRDTYARSSDSIAFYVSPENVAVRKFVEGTPSWSVQALRALVPCNREGTTPRDGVDGARRAKPADASVIVDIVNACHDGEELYVPYTVESFTARVERAPDQYTWDDIHITDGAVVGVGTGAVEVLKERDGERRRTRRALVLDHGCLPGAEQRYSALLDGVAAGLGGTDVTHLAVFTSGASRTKPVLTALAEELEPFDFWAFDIPEPPKLRDQGLYVDAVYF